MSVTVKLFASYAESLGASTIIIDLADPANVSDVVKAVAKRPGGSRLPVKPLIAVNQRYAPMTAPVKAGDEIAFIPPVAGG